MTAIIKDCLVIFLYTCNTPFHSDKRANSQLITLRHGKINNKYLYVGFNSWPRRRTIQIMMNCQWIARAQTPSTAPAPCLGQPQQDLSRHISHAGVTPGQFTVLRTLHEGDAAGLTQSKLTRAMSSAPTPSPHCLSTWKRAGGLSVGRMKLTGAPTVSC